MKFFYILIMFGIGIYVGLKDLKNEDINTLAPEAHAEYEPSNKGAINNELKAWATSVASNIGDYSYFNLNRDLRVKKEYFSESGWNGYLQALKASGTISYLTENKVNLSLIVQTEPRILKVPTPDAPKFEIEIKVKRVSLTPNSYRIDDNVIRLIGHVSNFNGIEITNAPFLIDQFIMYHES